MNTKERLKEFLSFKKIGQNRFAKICGFSDSLINNSKGSLGSDVINKIGNQYPELNLDWLITGNGEMLKDTSIADYGSFSIAHFKQRGYAPAYSELQVAAGSLDLILAGQNEAEPDGWIKIPGVTADAWFPITGLSMEPKIYSGDWIGVVTVHNWERIDPDRIYMVITIFDRMIKHLQFDESNPESIWAISENPHVKPFKLHRSEIKGIYRVVWSGRLV